MRERIGRHETRGSFRRLALESLYISMNRGSDSLCVDKPWKCFILLLPWVILKHIKRCFEVQEQRDRYFFLSETGHNDSMENMLKTTKRRNETSLFSLRVWSSFCRLSWTTGFVPHDSWVHFKSSLREKLGKISLNLRDFGSDASQV